MDDATKLISELQNKLSELDNKVATYRSDMTAEFSRYSDQQLQQVPDNVSSAVSRVIAESMSNYTSLYPSCEPPDSPASTGLDSRLWNGRKSPPPILYHTSGVPKEGPRSPHEREKEFHGVFTPSYLPLLDSSDRPLHSPPIISPSALLFDDSKTTEATQTTDGLEDLMRPPPLVRRATDSSSVESSGSEAKVRRSALRRSSSASNKASPRRVRFDFQGEEVLPTASPQASEMALTRLGNGTPPRGLLYDSNRKPLLPNPFESEDNSPPARKVSSSERLRALSKIPLEDPANWTVVNPQPDPDESAAIQAGERAGASDHFDASKGKAPVRLQVELPEKKGPTSNVLGSPLQDLEQHEENDSSEDDFISMKPSKKSSVSPTSRSPVLSSIKNSATDNTSKMSTQPATSPRKSRERGSETEMIKGAANGKAEPARSDHHAEDHSVEGDNPRTESDDEQLFDFDDDSIGYPLTRTPKAKPKHDVTQEGAEHFMDPGAGLEAELASSPAVTMPQRMSPPAPASVGSYRGRPITTFEVVKDHRLYEKAAELGNFNSFVGSVDGRSGVDGGDINSFRASLSNVQYSGTPRSLAERMAMEEAQIQRGRTERR